MAEEQSNAAFSGKMKFVLWVVGLIFVAGMTHTTITSNTEDIKENRGDIKGVKEQVLAVQRGQDRIGYNIQTIQQDIAEQKTARFKKDDADRKYQNEQRRLNTEILIELGKWEAIKDGQNP